MITNADRAHLARAARLAKESTQRQQHGCVAAVGKRVLAVGVNSFRAHPSTVSDPKSQASIHAEASVLRQLNVLADPRLTLYVARVNKQGKPMLSAPCSRCQDLAQFFGIRKIIFTTEIGYGVWFDE